LPLADSEGGLPQVNPHFGLLGKQANLLKKLGHQETTVTSAIYQLYTCEPSSRVLTGILVLRTSKPAFMLASEFVKVYLGLYTSGYTIPFRQFFQAVPSVQCRLFVLPVS
jgi:hypothetical protein